MSSPQPPASRPKRPLDLENEEEMELPPLDADDEDEEAADPALEEGLLPLEDDGADPLDDATAADLEIGVEIGGDDDDPTGGDEPAEEGIDVGPLDEGLLDEADDRAPGSPVGKEGDEAHERHGPDDGFDDLDDLDDGDDDGGEEGTGEPIEDEVNDEDLPELDADEGGDFEGEDLIAELQDHALEDRLPPWDPTRWVAREGAGGAVPCCAVAVDRARVVAAGDVLLIVDEGAHAARRAGATAGGVSLAIADATIFVATARGGLLAIPDSAGPSAVASWRARRGPIELAATPGRLWIRSSDSLWRIPTPVDNGPYLQAPVGAAPADAAAPASIRDRGIRAITVSGGALIALTVDAASASIERKRGDDEGWQVTPLTGDALEAARGEGARIAATAGGLALCIADPARDLCVSRDGGATFLAAQLRGVVAVAFAGDDPAAPLLAVLDVEEGAYVAQVPSSGHPTLVAEITAAGSDDPEVSEDSAPLGAAAIAWDAAREVAWIASRAGLLALGRARKH